MYCYLRISLNAVGNTSQVSSPLSDSEMNMTNSIPRSVTKLTSSGTPLTAEELAEESQRKRDIRLRKNRYFKDSTIMHAISLLISLHMC